MDKMIAVLFQGFETQVETTLYLVGRGMRILKEISKRIGRYTR